MTSFGVQGEQVDLPRGAFHKAPRTYVTWGGRPVLGLSQNDHRAYLFPVCTPAGVPVTSESPTDHPHHNSVWVGADHVTALLPFAEDRFEEATYSFYINQTFQGRATGRIVAGSFEHRSPADDHLQLIQAIDWIGPVEWGAPDGRTIAHETRTTSIRHLAGESDGPSAFLIDVTCALTPTEWSLRIGPTRHAWFGIRLVEPLRPSLGGQLANLSGPQAIADIVGQPGSWIQVSAEVVAGHTAGVVVIRDPETAKMPWSLHEWGTIDVNPLGTVARDLATGDTLSCRLRLVVHDGSRTPEQIDQLARLP